MVQEGQCSLGNPPASATPHHPELSFREPAPKAANRKDGSIAGKAHVAVTASGSGKRILSHSQGSGRASTSRAKPAASSARATSRTTLEKAACDLAPSEGAQPQREVTAQDASESAQLRAGQTAGPLPLANNVEVAPLSTPIHDAPGIDISRGLACSSRCF